MLEGLVFEDVFRYDGLNRSDDLFNTLTGKNPKFLNSIFSRLGHRR